MILNNFLQNIAFSHRDFDPSADFATLHIVKRLDFDEETSGPALDAAIEPAKNPPLDPLARFSHKRIRPFNLNSDEESENSIDSSEKSSPDKKNLGSGKINFLRVRSNSFDLPKFSDINTYLIQTNYIIIKLKNIHSENVDQSSSFQESSQDASYFCRPLTSITLLLQEAIRR